MDELLNELEASENSTQPPPAAAEASDSDVRHLVSDDHALCNIISGENENTDSPADSRPETTTIIEVADARSPESHESTGSLLHTTDNRFGEDLVQNEATAEAGISDGAESNSKEIIGEMQNRDDVDDPQDSESRAEDVTTEEDGHEECNGILDSEDTQVAATVHKEVADFEEPCAEVPNLCFIY
ncbi:unnamed protein product [Gongylonema pulchrum]|uniref:FYVE, RhoGEF and PH domain-containing protein 5 n=1 Tax=Gongylonema pulchrum TaxID=637853 RepID=A0A183E312_9BILA|nr:unnamed protein product [Gongylonema pulchrum]